MPGICWIQRQALDDLLSEARGWPLRETGGALLGRRESELAVVEEVLGPGPHASHGFRHFEPDAKWQLREGERIYAESGRTVAYLGDWHTHPHGRPHPSSQDHRTAEMIATTTGFRAPRPVYAIASKCWHRLPRPSWRLRMMEWHRGGLEEMELIVLEEGVGVEWSGRSLYKGSRQVI
jgi:integrative and conjugative element protein (TIGR02256 family)